MEKKIGKILAVDDNEDILFSIKLLLKPYAELVHTELNPERIPELMQNEEYDVILLDMNFTKDMIKKHGYVKLDIDDVVTCKDPDDGKLIVGFECWYRYDYFEDAIKILRTFDVDDEDIEIYIPKKEYPMLIQANKKNIYLGIAPRVSYGDKPRFLLKEEKIK